MPGVPSLFLLGRGEVLELQRTSFTKMGSFFVGDSVVKGGHDVNLLFC